MKSILKNGSLRAVAAFATLVAMVFVACVFVSCDNDVDSIVYSSAEVNPLSIGVQSSPEYAIQIAPGNVQPFSEPTHGLPNVTPFKFFAANVGADIKNVEILFKAPDGATYRNFWMSKVSGTQNWFLTKTLSQPGRYTVTYELYRTNNTSFSVTAYPGYVDVTSVNASISSNTDNSWIKVHWVFGDDGSSYASNSAYKNENHIKWLDGNEA